MNRLVSRRLNMAVRVRDFSDTNPSADPSFVSVLGRLKEAHRAVAEANRIWPFDTVRTHVPNAPFNRKFGALMDLAASDPPSVNCPHASVRLNDSVARPMARRDRKTRRDSRPK